MIRKSGLISMQREDIQADLVAVHAWGRWMECSSTRQKATITPTLYRMIMESVFLPYKLVQLITWESCSTPLLNRRSKWMQLLPRLEARSPSFRERFRWLIPNIFLLANSALIRPCPSIKVVHSTQTWQIEQVYDFATIGAPSLKRLQQTDRMRELKLFSLQRRWLREL